MTMMANSESKTIADARLTAVSINGAAACQTRSPVRSDRWPTRTMITDASANGMELSSPVCMLVRSYDRMICGCHS